MAKNKCPVCNKSCEGEACFLHKAKKQLKKGSKLKSRKKTVEEIEANIKQREDDFAFYSKIWEKRPHVCQSCDAPIYGQILSIYFDHLLEKQSFEELRYEEDNILLVCMNCHTLKNNGFPTEAHEQAIEKAKEIFNI